MDEEFGEDAEDVQDRTCDVRVYVRNTGSQDVTGVALTVQAAWPVVTQDTQHSISHLPCGRQTPHMITLRFSYAADMIPPSQEVWTPLVRATACLQNETAHAHAPS